MHTSPRNARLLPKALLTLLLVATASATIPPVDALAQFKPDGFTDVKFGDGIEGVETTLDGLLDVLEAHTTLEGTTSKEARFLLVYGVGLDTRVYDAIASVPVNFVPGQKPFIGLGAGPLASPWQAFDIPLAGFDIPLAGLQNPLVKFDIPLAGFDIPLAGFDDPTLGLQKIWGTGGVAVEEGFYGLVLFTMPDPSFPGNENVQIQHRAAIVPFRTSEAPEPVALDGAYPNPFNPRTTIRYTLAEAAPVRLTVYDLLGREVAVLVDGPHGAGRHTAVFDAAGLPGGVYLYRLATLGHAQTGRLTLMK